MYPPEQPYQEPPQNQTYGHYTGAEPSQMQYYEASHFYHPNHSEGMPPPMGLPGSDAQQQFFAQPPYPTYMRLLPAGRFSAVLSYCLGWFSALLILFFGWQNRFIRFHALQSLFFFGVVNVFDFVFFRMLFVWHQFHFWHQSVIWLLLMFCIFLVINTIAAIAWLVGMIQASMGNYYKLPLIGDLVMRRFVTPPSVK